MHRVPRFHLHTDFVRACRQSDYALVALSAIAGFAAYTQLSALLNARRVRGSALMIERLQRVADAVSYRGPMFRESTR